MNPPLWRIVEAFLACIGALAIVLTVFAFFVARAWAKEN